MTQQSDPSYIIASDAQEDIFSNNGTYGIKAHQQQSFFRQYPGYSNPFSSDESLVQPRRDVSPPIRQRNAY